MIKYVHNLIILDRSGSMISIREQAVAGINSTLRIIRSSAEESNIQQYVTLCSFCSCEMRDTYLDTPIEIIKDFRAKDYEPCCCTPLYDAIGRCCTRLEETISAKEHPEEHAVSVTIITDGYENDSRKFTSLDISRLIEKLKGNGWLFAFIGANIDVERVAKEMKIDHSMEFIPTPDGTSRMFACEAAARRKWTSNLENVSSAEDLEELNQDYFE